MENLEILPWYEEGMTDDLYVPEYIEHIGYAVLKQYDFSVYSMEIVATKPFKGGAIWKIETSDGPKSLKLLHRRPPRSIFSLGAQDYLVNVQNARVPAIVPTKKGQKCVLAANKIWFVAQWIESLTPATNDLEGAKQLCYGLGEFHRLSRGYVPPRNAEVSSRMYKWQKSFKKMSNKIDWFRNIAIAYNDMPASESLLKVVDLYEKQAILATESLQNSKYIELTKYGNEHWGLVHQDYGWSNGQVGTGGVWIIDLDGVSYDIPIRDLRKLVAGMMFDLGNWDPTWMREMIRAYHEANPISKEVYDLLIIDLSFPNAFYRNLKEMIYQPELFLNEDAAQLIEDILSADATKWPALQEIENDWKDVSSKQ